MGLTSTSPATGVLAVSEASATVPGDDRCMSKKAGRRPRPPHRLVQDLALQMEFLRRSCWSYDDGFEGEACRLAVALRVLLHNTDRSAALLTQAGLLTETTLFADSSQPIDPENLLPNPGLVIMTAATGNCP